LRRLNFQSPDFDYDETDPPGFRCGAVRMREAIGGEKLGASLYEIPEGEAVCPYHYEDPEEEWLLVLDGTPSVRTVEGEEELAPGEAVCFPAGPEGAHQVLNRAAETARVMIVSTRNHPAIAVYPDSDKIGTFTTREGDNKMFRRESAVDYYDGETEDGP